MGPRAITAPLQLSRLTERAVEIEREEAKSFMNETTRTMSFQAASSPQQQTDGYCGGHTPVRTLNGKVKKVETLSISLVLTGGCWLANVCDGVYNWYYCFS